MTVYMVERELKGISMDQLAAAQKKAIATGKDMTAKGKNVRYIRSTFVPGEARCMCLFEAPSQQNVRELNDTAGIPYSRIVEALDLTP
jgi:muconolactone delta-isomerase